jgi:hypothetical protein
MVAPELVDGDRLLLYMQVGSDQEAAPAAAPTVSQTAPQHVMSWEAQ